MKVKKASQNENVIYGAGAIKGIYTKHSVTVIPGQKEKYGYTLQEVNDRICSYRPNVSKEEVAMGKWDGITFDFGLYPSYGDPKEPITSKLFKDFKTLATSAAALRGYLHPSKVRGGTPQDVDDFLNFVVIKLCERRLRQFDPSSRCRELDNWSAYIAITIPQYLILYNKSKFDYEVEDFWPLVKDEKTSEWKQKDFGIEADMIPRQFMNKKTLSSVLHKVISKIPESEGIVTDLMFYLTFGVIINNNHKKLIPLLSDIIKIQLMDKEGELY